MFKDLIYIVELNLESNNIVSFDRNSLIGLTNLDKKYAYLIIQFLVYFQLY
jgi:hypothetical protein